MKRLVSVVVVSLLAMMSGRGEEVVLIKDGKPVATLVTSTNSPAPVELAVAELQSHLKKMTGVMLPRKTDRGEVAGAVVLVGESERTRQLGLRGGDFKRREYLVQTRPGMLILMGRDQQIFSPLRYDTKLTEEMQFLRTFALWDNGTEYDEVGTALAVYHFLERECGVRWYLPSDAGTFIPDRKTVAAENLDVRRAPWMHYVGSALRLAPKKLYAWDPAKSFASDDLASWRDSHLWHLRNKMYGGEPVVFSHAYLGWYDLFSKDHPEWFSKGHEHGNPNKRQFCYTNKELITRIIKEAGDYFDGQGNKQLRMAPRAQYKRWVEGADIVSVAPLDGGGWCQCERCQAMLDPAGEVQPPLSDYHSGFASRYIFSFITQIADAIAESHPDKRVGCIAYYKYFQCPALMTGKRENLSVGACIVSRSWQCWPAAAECEKREMEKWKKAAGRLYAYIYDQAHDFPAWVYDEDEKRMRYFQQLGVYGLFLDGLSTCVADKRPAIPGGKAEKVILWRNPLWDLFFWYGIVKMADDPDRVMADVYDELYKNWYGKAAPAIKAFVEHAQKLYNDPRRGVLPDGMVARNGAIVWTDVCRPADMQTFGRHIAAAYQLADTPESRARVTQFDEAIWQCMQNNRRQSEKFEATKQVPAPKVAIPRTVQPAADLGSLTWETAKKLDAFKTMFGQPVGELIVDAQSGKSVKHPLTEVATMYDAANIYLRIACYDPDTKGLRRDQQEHDHPGIGSDDSVEIFFDPGQTKKDFKQIIVNANGAVCDMDQKGKEWESQCNVRVSVESNQWIIVAAIPIKELEEQGLRADGANLVEGARPGAVWGFNICRNFRQAGGRSFYSAWSPTFGGWRMPERFGMLTFEAGAASLTAGSADRDVK